MLQTFIEETSTIFILLIDLVFCLLLYAGSDNSLLDFAVFGDYVTDNIASQQLNESP